MDVEEFIGISFIFIEQYLPFRFALLMISHKYTSIHNAIYNICSTRIIINIK